MTVLATHPLREQARTRRGTEVFRPAAPPEDVLEALARLGEQGGVTSLGLILRMEEGLADWVDEHAGEEGPLAAIRRSAFHKADLVRGALEYAIPRGSRWRDALTLHPAIHCCSVRAPTAYLKKFLGSGLFGGGDHVIAGVLLDAAVQCPGAEVEAAARRSPEEMREKVGKIVRLTKGSNGEDAYLNSLGIGDFSGGWAKDYKGSGQRACLIDSGADESHPALQERFCAHAFFDSHGHYKEAKYITDRGCHGTKIASLIVGRSLPLDDWGLSGSRPLRVGLAPEAKIAAVNVLQGEYLRERGTMQQFLAGAEWATENSGHPEFGGYEVVNISIEVKAEFSDVYMRKIDGLLDYMREGRKLVPLLACGNQGGRVTRLGTRGCYVGACDGFGKRWKSNGNGATVHAPGVDLLCAQPDTPQLGNDIIGAYSGTSLASGVVTGCILLLCEATRRPAGECLDALVANQRHGMVNLDAAYKALGGG